MAICVPTVWNGVALVYAFRKSQEDSNYKAAHIACHLIIVYSYVLIDSTPLRSLKCALETNTNTTLPPSSVMYHNPSVSASHFEVFHTLVAIMAHTLKWKKYSSVHTPLHGALQTQASQSIVSHTNT